LGQIRGDYAVILVEGDQIFIMKDYFGKRSLLVGMGENHLLLTSAPHEQLQREEQVENAAGDDENE
jgi:asparagine synthetase B (glutamine-hydrolysing)